MRSLARRKDYPETAGVLADCRGARPPQMTCSELAVLRRRSSVSCTFGAPLTTPAASRSIRREKGERKTREGQNATIFSGGHCRRGVAILDAVERLDFVRVDVARKNDPRPLALAPCHALFDKSNVRLHGVFWPPQEKLSSENIMEGTTDVSSVLDDAVVGDTDQFCL